MVTTDAWSNQQCQNTRQKANRTRDSICRTLSPCSKQVKTRTYARLHLTRVRFKGMESVHCKNWSTHLSKYMYKDQRLGLSLWLQENNILTSALVLALGCYHFHTRRLVAQSSLFHRWHHQLTCLYASSSRQQPTSEGMTSQPSLPYPQVLYTYKFATFPRTVRI